MLSAMTQSTAIGIAIRMTQTSDSTDTLLGLVYTARNQKFPSPKLNSRKQKEESERTERLQVCNHNYPVAQFYMKYPKINIYDYMGTLLFYRILEPQIFQ